MSVDGIGLCFRVRPRHRDRVPGATDAPEPIGRCAGCPRRGHHGDVRGVICASTVVAMITIVACSSGGKGDLTGPWLDRGGKPVADGTERRDAPPLVVQTYGGASHCGWESVVFMEAGWPLGREITSQGQVRQFVRDSEQALREGLLSTAPLLGTLDLTAELPRDARFSGLHREGNEIWVSESSGDRYVFIKRRGDTVERWPRVQSPIRCE